MTVRPKTARRATLETLEERRLLAIVNVASFGAIPGDAIDDSAAIQRAIDRSAEGDTVQFGAGAFTVNSSLTLRGNRTYEGLAGAQLKFSVADGRYGLMIYRDSSDVTVKGLKLINGGISLSQGSRYSNISIINNEIQGTADTPGIYASIQSERLIIEGNKFTNLDGWGVILWHMNNGSFSKNLLCNVHQGAHIMAPRDNNRVNENIGRHITRMGIEMQAHGGSIAHNTEVIGNVFYDWRLPYHDSFGLSIVPDRSENTVIRGNYLAAVFNGQWNPQTANDGQGQRFGYGIEAGFSSGVVEDNIIAGPFANHVTVSHPNTLVRNNKFFGVPAWRDYIASEPGPNGGGSFIDQGNTIDRNMANRPAAPGVDPCLGVPGGGGVPVPTPTPTPVPKPKPTQGAPVLTGQAVSSSRIDLTWNDVSTTELGYKVERSTTGPNGPWTHLALVGKNITRYSNNGLPAGKTFYYRVRVYDGSATVHPYSNVLTITTPASGGTAGGGLNGLSSFGTGSSGSNDESPFASLLI